MSTYKLPEELIYDGYVYPGMVTSPKMLTSVGDLSLTSEDAIVVTYPKCGTHWMKYLAYLVLHGGDPPATKTTPPVFRQKHMEFRLPGEKEDDVLEAIQTMPSPRLLSSHIRFQDIEKLVIEKKVKVIVVIRNPKDVLASLFHFYQMNVVLGQFKGTWGEFFELFKEKRLGAGGGDFFDFNTTWWQNRNRDNVFITFYEEMKRNPKMIVEQVAQFLGKDLPEDKVGRIVHETSFGQMKNNDMANGTVSPFHDHKISAVLRKGQVGDWKHYFSAEQSEYVDQLCQKCASIGLSFTEFL